MQSIYYPPEYKKSKFHCAICNVFAKQEWFEATYHDSTRRPTEIEASKCDHCYKLSYWYDSKLTIPQSSIAPMPHEDMPENVSNDYLEAHSIINNSPRGAAALLRLCLQKLLQEIGEKGKNINDDIKSLVQKGLPEEVQQALDIVRVIGNEAVHPGELDIKDDQETAIHIFNLINFIVEDRITRKKKIGLLYSILPEDKRKQIEQRDAK